MSFATSSDLESWLGVDFDAADHTRAEGLLQAATNTIKAYTDQTIEQVVDDVEVKDGRNRRVLLLDEIPVTAVSSVVEDGTTLTVDDDYVWSETGELTRVGGCWPADPRTVTVTYTHGYATVPGELKDLCTALAARVWINPEQAAQRDFDQVSFTSASGIQGVAMTEFERRIADRHKP